MQDQSSRDAVARRAYEIWEAEGCPKGRHEAHWEKAEAELRCTGSHYSEMEQPGESHPREGSGLAQANQQAGEGNPRPSSQDPRQLEQRGSSQNGLH